MKKLISAIMAFCLACAITAYTGIQQGVYASDDASPASAVASPTEVSAKSAILMDSETGKVLFEKNSHEKLPPASVTKIMTMLLVMEKIEAGELKMEDTVTASTHASKMGGSQIWLKEGEQMTVHELMKAVAVASANDAAMALAEHVGSSEESFVAMMNDKARSLGMNDTVFVNPTGLDAEGHYSSAYDIALMSKALLCKKGITEFTTIWIDSLRGGKTELVNTNKLVRFYKGATGLKTGTTDGAGSCVSATATKGEMGLISVVMGCPTSAERFADARRLLDYGFANFVMYNTKYSVEPIQDVKVTGGVSPYASAKTDICKKMLIPSGKQKSVAEEITLLETIPAPVKAGQKIGSVKISIDSEVIAEYDVVAGEDIQKMTFGHGFMRLLKKIIQ